MRFLPALVLLLAPLAGCALNLGMNDARSNRAGVMTAWIMPDDARRTAGDSYTVYTSHDAHIAVFEVVPGRGIGMVYPSDGWHRDYMSAGLRRVVDIAPTHRWSYVRGAAFYPAGPRYVVLIASEMPLRIGALRESDFALRRAMHFQTFTAVNPYRSIDALVNMIVPAQDPAGWDMDVYAIWPDHSPRLADLRSNFKLVRVMCKGSGQVFTVPLRWLDGLPLRCGEAEEPPKTDDGTKVAIVDSARDEGPDRVAVSPGVGRDVMQVTSGRASYGPGISALALARRPVAGVDEDDPFASPAIRPRHRRDRFEAPDVRLHFGRDGWTRRRRGRRIGHVDRPRMPRTSRRMERARPSVPVTTRSRPAPTVNRATKPKTSSADRKKSSSSKKKRGGKKTKH